MAKTLAELSAEVEAEELSDQSVIVGLLLPYRDNQDAQNLYGKEASRLGARIKEWLALHPDEELWDGENNLVAKLQTKAMPGHKYDLLAIIENNPALFERLKGMGCLRIDHDAAVAADLGGEIKRYEFPRGETPALIVSRK